MTEDNGNNQDMDWQDDLNRFWSASPYPDLMERIKPLAELANIIIESILPNIGSFQGDIKEKVKGFFDKDNEFLGDSVRRYLLANDVDERIVEDTVSKVRSVSDNPSIWAMIGEGVSTVVGTVAAVAESVFAAQETAAQENRMITQHELPDLGSLVGAFYNLHGGANRFTDLSKVEENFRRHGISYENQWQMLAGMQKQLSWQDVAAIQSMNDLGEFDVDNLLMLSGWNTRLWSGGGKDLNRWVKDIIYTPLDVNQATLLDLRGKLDHLEWEKRLSRLGYKREDIPKLRQLFQRWPNLNEVFQMEHRGVLSNQDWNKFMLGNGIWGRAGEKLQSLLYRPMDYTLASEAYHRGLIDKSAFLWHMKANGLSPGDAEKAEEVSWLLPNPSDIVRFAVREVFSPDIAEDFGLFEEKPKDAYPLAEKIGIKPETLDLYWAAHWDLPSPTQGFDMYHRGEITEERLKKLLRALDYMPGWRDEMIAISHRLIPRRQIRYMLDGNIVNRAGAIELYQKLGYEDKDAAALADTDIKRNADAETKLTQNQVIDAFKRGWINEAQMRNYFRELNYSDERVEYLTRIARMEQEEHSTVQQQSVLERKADDVVDDTIDLVLDKYKEGMLDEESTREQLLLLGVPNELVEYQIAEIQFNLQDDYLDYYTKQIKRRYDARVIGETRARELLVQEGLVSRHADRVVRLWQVEKTTDDIVEMASPRLPSRTDLADWLKAGIINTETWVGYMRQHGYHDESITYYLQEIVISEGKS